MSRTMPVQFDATPYFRAEGPVVPVVYGTGAAALRQRVVNLTAKRYVDMMFVSGLDRATADRHFRRRPAPVPGVLSGEASDKANAAAVTGAWEAGQIVVETDAAARLVRVCWTDAAFGADVVGHAVARPGYGGIVLGADAALGFDAVPLRRAARKNGAWPIGDETAAVGRHGALHEAAEAFFAASPGLYGVMVATPGEVLLERYSAHGAAARVTPSFSMTKAITGTVIGRMIHEGWLGHVHDPAPAPLWRDPRDIHRLITLDHLMRMRSGLAFPTVDEAGGSGIGFENTFVYSNAEDAFATAQRGIVATVPGSVYRYINSGLNVLGAIIRDQIERRGLPYHATLYGLLADRIGMSSFEHSADRVGNMIASGSGFATLRDYTRFGLFLVQDGVWDGERLLPEGWVEYATAPSHAGSHYAACFRTNSDGTFPSLPRETAWASGASDQKVILLREHGVVITVTNETDYPISYPALDRLGAAAMAHVAGVGGLAAAAE